MEAKIKKARVQLILEQPFWASLILGLELKADPGHETIWTDGIHLRYNPEYVESLSLPELKGLIAHETLHCAMRHFSRQVGRDRIRWNMACDYAINPLLHDQGMVLPEGMLTDATYRNMSAEAIYAILSREQEKPGRSSNQPPNQGGTPGSGSGGGDDPSRGSGGESDDQTGAGKQASGSGNAASGGSETEGTHPAMIGEVRAPETTENQTRLIEQKWTRAWTQTRMVAKKRGDLPGDLDRAVKASDPTASWREILADYLFSTSKNDYSLSRPNRRFIHQGFHLPSMNQPTLGHIVIAVDTSGSVTPKELAAFTAEISALIDEGQPESVHILVCDYAIHKVIEYIPGMDGPLEIPLLGGGGTSFCPVFQWIEDRGEAPVLIYLTDLCGDFPESRPDYPVIWMVPRSGWTPYAPFGRTVLFSPH